MKMNTTNTLLLLTLALFLQSAGCQKVKELEYKGILNTKIEQVGLSNSSIRIDLGYYNPNNFGVDIKETNLSIYLNDRFVAMADQPEKTQIPKLSDFTFPVVAQFDPFKVLGTAFKTLFTQSSTLRIEGTAKLGKGGVYIRVPVKITEQVKLYGNR